MQPVSELVCEMVLGLSVNWDETDRIGFALKDILDHPEIFRNNLENTTLISLTEIKEPIGYTRT